MSENDPSPPRAGPAAEVVDLIEEATCLDCGYKLRALPEPRCPECGRVFDPADPETMKVPAYAKAPLMRLRTFGEEMIRASIVASALVILGRFDVGPVVVLYGIALWILILLAWGLRRTSSGRVPSLAEGPRWRPIVTLLLVLTMLMPCRFYSCPHASTLWFGPFGISYSNGNGPCHNAPHVGGVRIIGPWFYAYSDWL